MSRNLPVVPAETFRCAKCKGDKERGQFHEEQRGDRQRKVTAQCRECRSKAYYARRYPDVCPQCLQNRPLDKNGICADCNSDNGLRQCRACNELLIYLLEFYGDRKTCTHCRNTRRNLRNRDETLREV